jgi:hypothetical protein
MDYWSRTCGSFLERSAHRNHSWVCIGRLMGFTYGVRQWDLSYLVALLTLILYRDQYLVRYVPLFRFPEFIIMVGFYLSVGFQTMLVGFGHQISQCFFPHFQLQI